MTYFYHVYIAFDVNFSVALIGNVSDVVRVVKFYV